MKFSELREGESYWTKVGKNWQPVVLHSLRRDVVDPLNTIIRDKDRQVIVRTPAGNQIYRVSGQLHKTPK